jgi:hypothetical protein
MFNGRLALLVILCMGLTGMAMATPIGALNIANCPGGGVTVNLTTITWLPTGTVAGTGCIDTGIGTSVSYSGGTLGGGAVGNIQDLTSPTTFPVNNFMTFTGTPLDFILAALPAATATNGTNCASTTVGQSCVVFAGSPFLLTNEGSFGTAVSLTAMGTATDGSGPASNWSGTFTTQVPQTPSAIQSTITAGGSVTSTHSASFTVTSVVPEPGTISLALFGLAGVIAAARRKMRS